MKFAGIINYPLLDLGLSQIYLNENKIKAIEKWFNLNDMSIFKPLTVHDYENGKYTLTDGHSRAYVAYMNGLTFVPIVYDNDDMVAGKLGKILYCADIEWCGRFHIENISHLESRIITNEEYQRLWIRRCDRSYNLLMLTSEENREKLQKEVSELFLYGASKDLSEIYFENASGELFVYKNKQLFREIGG